MSEPSYFPVQVGMKIQSKHGGGVYEVTSVRPTVVNARCLEGQGEEAFIGARMGALMRYYWEPYEETPPSV